jgi:hypothetical protein
LKFPPSSADPPFLSKAFNAIAKKGNAEAKVATIGFMNSILLETIGERAPTKKVLTPEAPSGGAPSMAIS